ncbi:MAG: hypothetical protein WAV27_02440 [Xanthobacteraceae bacterium]
MTTTLKTLLALAMVASTLTAVTADGAVAACKRGNPNCLPSGGGPKFCGGTTNPCRIDSGLGSACKGSGAQCGLINLPGR